MLMLFGLDLALYLTSLLLHLSSSIGPQCVPLALLIREANGRLITQVA
jgi:hypothetical protein